VETEHRLNRQLGDHNPQGTTVIETLAYTNDAAENQIKTGGTFARSNIPPALTTTNYNVNNQQLTFDTSTETYDPNGNLATFIDVSGTTTYTWNARNQLTGISGPGLTGLRQLWLKNRQHH
jgi:YD repeat-containing protein